MLQEDGGPRQVAGRPSVLPAARHTVHRQDVAVGGDHLVLLTRVAVLQNKLQLRHNGEVRLGENQAILKLRLPLVWWSRGDFDVIIRLHPQILRV